jgi:voltage-gated potassium channel
MHLRKHHLRTWIATRSAPLMFVLSLAFLVCQAILVVVWVDVPNLSENAISAIKANSPEATEMLASLSVDIVDDRIQDTTIFVMLAIWPIVIIEAMLHWLTRPWDAETRKLHFFGFLFCVCPSLRMCARSPEMRDRLWLPGLGWRQANKRLRDRLERRFGMPMIMIALMIMPVLIIEFFMKSQVAQYSWLRILLHVSTGVIWFAFAAEFILMVSVADKKIAYCKKNWIDLAIILLPLFSFLRSLRLLRATRMANAVRLQQLTKMARVYRLRGTAVKALRALIVLEFFHRFISNDVDRKIEKLQAQLADVESEAKEIRRKIARLERDRSCDEAISDNSRVVNPLDDDVRLEEAAQK